MVTQVSENLYRGPRPSTVEKIEELKALGITTILNLQSGVYETFHDDYYESKCHELGMNTFRIHCSDISPPTETQVKRFLSVIDLTSKTYVHCLHGVDRTGYMCAVYRIERQNWSWAAAVKEMFAMGFHKWPYLWWIWVLKIYGK